MKVPIKPDGTPVETTKVKPFVAGHGRTDLDMLHRVVQALDIGATSFEVREMVAEYINNRPDREGVEA